MRIEPSFLNKLIPEVCNMAEAAFAAVRRDRATRFPGIPADICGEVAGYCREAYSMREFRAARESLVAALTAPGVHRFPWPAYIGWLLDPCRREQFLWEERNASNSEAWWAWLYRYGGTLPTDERYRYGGQEPIEGDIYPHDAALQAIAVSIYGEDWWLEFADRYEFPQPETWINMPTLTSTYHQPAAGLPEKLKQDHATRFSWGGERHHMHYPADTIGLVAEYCCEDYTYADMEEMHWFLFGQIDTPSGLYDPWEVIYELRMQSRYRAQLLWEESEAEDKYAWWDNLVTSCREDSDHRAEDIATYMYGKKWWDAFDDWRMKKLRRECAIRSAENLAKHKAEKAAKAAKYAVKKAGK